MGIKIKLKRVDLMVDAFRRMPDKKLVVGMTMLGLNSSFYKRLKRKEFLMELATMGCCI
jgi:hypothetical protein